MMRSYYKPLDLSVRIQLGRESISRGDFHAFDKILAVVTFLIRGRVQALGVDETHDFSKANATVSGMPDHVTDTKGFLFPVLEFI